MTLDNKINNSYQCLNINHCPILKYSRRFIDCHDISQLDDLRSKKYRCGIIIVTPDSKVLIVQNRSSKIWGLPKGKIDTHDTSLSEAASRELFEETGIYLEPSQDNSFRRTYGTREYYYIMCVNFAPNIKFVPIDKYEIGKVRLIAIHNVPNLKYKNKGLLDFYRHI